VNKRYFVAKKQKTKVNTNRHQKDTMYQVDCDDPRPSSDVHIAEAGTSENSRHINLGNFDESLRGDEIAINYVETEPMIKKLPMSTYISPRKLLRTFKMI
jgi:hypothetical protein